MTNEQRQRMSDLIEVAYTDEDKVRAAIEEIAGFKADGGDAVSQGQALEVLRMTLGALQAVRYHKPVRPPKPPRKPRRQRRLYADPVAKQNQINALGKEHSRLERLMRGKLVRVFNTQHRAVVRALREVLKVDQS